MKILMIGFGRGANIQVWLDAFQENKIHELYYVCSKFEFSKEKYKSIKILEVSSRRVFFTGRFFKEYFLKKFDVLYIQGLYFYSIPRILIYLTRPILIATNLWNNRNYKKVSVDYNKDIKTRLGYKCILSKSDIIFVNTEPVFNDFSRVLPQYRHKCEILPWGINPKVFDCTFRKETNDTKMILGRVAAEDTVLLMPRSFGYPARQDLLIDAINLLNKSDTLSVCKVILMSGLSKNDKESKKLKSMVKKYGLESIILIFDEKSLDYQEYMEILDRSDLVISLTESDQFSNAILEAMAREKMVLLSNINEYCGVIREYGFYAIFTNNSAEEIAMNIKRFIIKGKDELDEAKKRNRDIVYEKLNFKNTFNKRFSIIEKQITLSKGKKCGTHLFHG